MNLTTLCYIEKEDKYLMLNRILKENDINKGKWIGVGGHFEEGESPEECLLREVEEETGLRLTSYTFRGLLTFIADNSDPIYICLYTAYSYEGEVIDCNEGILEWIPKKDIFKLKLWEGDEFFLKLLLEDAPFFSMKLQYEKDKLISCYLDGLPIYPNKI